MAQTRHAIATRSCLKRERRAVILVLSIIASRVCRVSFPAGSICFEGGRCAISSKRLLKSDRGESTYLSAVVYVLIAVIVLALALNVFSILAAKREMDQAADQMVKQIQLAGGINADTEALFQQLCGEMPGTENVSYTIEAVYKSPRPAGMQKAIQLGKPFTVTVTGNAKLGGMWNLIASQVRLTAKGAGVSERYWK